MLCKEWFSLEDTIHQIIRSLEAFYWLMMEVLKVIEALKSHPSPVFKFHATLAYNRVKTIIDNLKAALKQVGLTLKEKPEEAELRSLVGSLAMGTLNVLKTAVSSLKHESNSGGSPIPSKFLLTLIECSENRLKPGL